MTLDLDAIKASQKRVYYGTDLADKEAHALAFLDSGVVDDLVTEVERLRHVLETHEAQYRRHRDDGYRLSAKHERERDEARAALDRVRALHAQEPGVILRCRTCGLGYPCATVRAISTPASPAVTHACPEHHRTDCGCDLSAIDGGAS